MVCLTTIAVVALVLSLQFKGTATALNRCDGKPKDITAPTGILTSPKHPSYYSHNMFCVWRITVPRGKTLKLTFVSFHLESHSKCRYDYVKLQNGLTFGSPFLGKYCGSNLPPTRYANSGSMLLTFKSDNSVSHMGFKAVFTSVLSTYSGCSSTPLEITGAKGNIKSPNYPSEYSDNLNCTWRITSPEGMRLNLTFDSFQLESSSTCKYDYVVVRDGSSLLGKFCGKTLPAEKIAESGTMQVTFVSDGSVRHSGFLASYSAVPLGNEACNGSPKEITESNGVLTSPNFPHNYNFNQRCVWKLKVPDDKVVQLSFTLFALEGLFCSDHVEIRSGWTNTSSVLGKFCGQSTPPTLYSDGRTMMVTFSSDGSVSYQGFHAVFTAVSVLECPLGTYMKTDSTSFSCTACPQHMITKQKGAKSKSSCECKQGFITSYINGEKNCQEKFCYELKAGPRDRWRIVGHCNRRYSDICKFTCNEGYITSDPLTTQCKQNTWSSPPPICKAITCGFVPQFKGTRYPNCINNKGDGLSINNYGAVCTYSVRYGYRLIGDNRIECKKDGRWHGNVQTALITCPVLQDIKNGMLDNPFCSDPKRQRTLGLVCTYYCNKGYRLNGASRKHCGEDGTWKPISNIAICQDNEPPLVDSCPKDQTIVTTKYRTNVSWTEPKFTDNSGKFRLQRNRAPGEMTLGKHSIVYTATDESGNSATCKFTLSVQPNDCPILDPPINGYITCDTWLLGRFCTIHCDERFEFSQKPEPLYVCGGSGKWAPPGSTPFPDCSKIYNPKVARVGIKTAQYSKGDCNNKTVQTEIKKKYIEIFSKTLYGLAGGCTGNKQCKVENVIVKCGKMNLTILAGNGNRKKRDIEIFQSKFAYFATRRSEQSDDELRSSGSGKERKTLSNIMLKQDKDVEDVLQNNRSDLRCERGHFLQNETNCVRCPVGTYQPTGREGCLQCPRGYFNRKEAQVSCTKCPSNKTTNATGAETESYCLSPCKPGFYSATGLEPCVSCPEGHFQNESGRKSCKQCPEKTTTSKRGAVHIQGCQGG